MGAWVRRHATLLLIGASLLLSFPYFPELRNPNEAVRIWTTRALVTHGTFAIEEVEREWGEVGDRSSSYGRRVSSKAPGTSLLGVLPLWVQTRALAVMGKPAPGPAASTWTLRVFAVALPLMAFYAFFSRELTRLKIARWGRDLLMAGLALGTMMHPYGLLFVGHALAAAAAMSAFLLARPEDASGRRLALAGALAGATVWFEYQAVVAVVAMTVWVVLRHRSRAAWWIAGAVPLALALGGYHAALFGSPFTFPYAHLDDPMFQSLHHNEGFYGVARPRLAVLANVTFATDYGLFAFSPFLLAGLIALVVTFVRHPDRDARTEAALALAIVTGLLLLVSGMANWRGGWCAGGPRYAAAAVPFLVWPLARAFGEIDSRWPLRVGLTGLVITSVVLCGLSAAVFPHFPLQFRNPVWSVAVRLLREGFAPGGLGRAVGLPGALALAPVATAALGAVIAACRAAPAGRRFRLALGGAAIALVWLTAAAQLPPANAWSAREEERAFVHVRSLHVRNSP